MLTCFIFFTFQSLYLGKDDYTACRKFIKTDLFVHIKAQNHENVNPENFFFFY